MLTTATIEILSDLGATLTWESTGSLGTLLSDEISTFYVKANLSTSSFNLQYRFASSVPGALPSGLTLNSDGTIQGKHTVTTVGRNTYTFAVAVVDSTGYEFISREEFTLETLKTTSTNYTPFFFKSHLNLDDRKKFKNFINDKKIFVPELLYRPNDLNFGLQKELKMVLNFGVNDGFAFSTYQTILEENFAKRKLKLGNLKSAIAKENNKNLYEIIYIDIIDDYNPNNVINTSTSFTFNGTTYYPPSINNMRQRLKTEVGTTESLNPKFTKTVQPTTLKTLNYVAFVPLCYCIPNKSTVLLKNIQNSGFKFNQINFEIDRVYVRNKYLLFDNRN